MRYLHNSTLSFYCQYKFSKRIPLKNLLKHLFIISVLILIYIFLGAVGLPVFSGFNGGIGALLNVTGGYIVGFIFSALTYWLITSIFNKKPRKTINLIASFMGLIVCYIFGTLWYILLFIKNGDTISFTSAFTICVLPFIIPDVLKILLASSISEKINKLITKN